MKHNTNSSGNFIILYDYISNFVVHLSTIITIDNIHVCPGQYKLLRKSYDHDERSERIIGSVFFCF